MAASSTLVSSAAGRYATALFELAGEADALERTEADTEALGQALEASDDLRALLSTPIYTRDEQGRAMAAVVEAMGLSALVANLVGLMAAKGRLFLLGPGNHSVIGIFAALMAEHRGEVTAEVTAARALSDGQQAALVNTLKAAIGREVKLNLTVDEGIIGGLVVKVGSKMIDTSIRSKLASLQNAMREVG